MNLIMFLMWSNGPWQYPLWSVLGPIWYLEGEIFKFTFYTFITVLCVWGGWLLLPWVVALIAALVDWFDRRSETRDFIRRENERVALDAHETRHKLEELAKERARFESLPAEEKQKIIDLARERQRQIDAAREADIKREEERLEAERAHFAEIEDAKRAKREAIEREHNRPERVKERAISSLIGRRR